MNTITLNRERLIKCREKLGITKQEAALRMQLSQPAYLRYESGERVPSIHVVHYMAHVFKTSTDYLIGKTDDPTPNSYMVSAKETPDLFAFIEAYTNSDINTQGRLVAYLRKISAHINKNE